MLQRTDGGPDSLTVEGARIDLIERGSGRSLLFLHAENGIEPAHAAIDELAKSAHVIAPTLARFVVSHPEVMVSVHDGDVRRRACQDSLYARRSEPAPADPLEASNSAVVTSQLTDGLRRPILGVIVYEDHLPLGAFQRAA